MKLKSIIILMVLLTPILIPIVEGATPYGKIEVNADIQLLDVPNHERIFGAYVTWHISGEITKVLRMRIKEMAEEEMGYSNVSRINITIASHYFKRKLEPVIEQNKYNCGYVGFIKVLHADPEHDDIHGILKNAADVEGLIGPVDSSDEITLRMIVRGEPVEGRMPIVKESLFFAPFYALASNESDFQNMIEVKKVKTNTEATGILGGFGNFYTTSGHKVRFVIGEYFSSPGGYVGYSSFDALNSPLVLFIISISLGITIRRVNKVWGKDAEEDERKKGLRYSRISRGLIILSYLFMPTDGTYLLLLIGVLSVLTIVILHFNYKKEYEEVEEVTEDEGEGDTQQSTEDI